METTLKRATIIAHEYGARDFAPPRSSLDDYMFQLHLRAILSAHEYGHLNEASAMRAVAKAIQECLMSHPLEYW